MKRARVGLARGEGDGCRRYLANQMSFDTRAHMLDPIGATWGEDVRVLSVRNRELVRTELIHEFGNHEHERKIEDFAALGSAPWSVIDQHNAFMAQVRTAFVAGAYYPALVAACALGERILNELVVRLRRHFPEHEATVDVAEQGAISNWGACIKALVGWRVLDEQAATEFYALSKLRHSAIHYNRRLNGVDARDEALKAVRALQDLISALFPPLGGPPRFIAGTSGHTFISSEAETQPFVREFVLRSCVLVSPHFEMRPTSERWFEVWDDDSYQEEFPHLTDEEFADHRNHPRRPGPSEPSAPK
jgi:hypothetical protein